MVLETYIFFLKKKASQLFWKKKIASKIRKMDQNGPKQSFLNLLKNLVINFYWICSIMKIYIICCVHTQISYLGKFLLVGYMTQCSQPIKSQDFSTNPISRTNRWNSRLVNEWHSITLACTHTHQYLFRCGNVACAKLHMVS